MSANELAATASLFSPAVPTDGVNGAGCAAHKDFCFFCEFAIQSNDDSDPRYEMSQMVKLLLEQGAGLDAVVASVDRLYRSNIQCEVEWYNPHTKTKVKGPPWSKASIARHLLHGGSEFDGVFDMTIDQIMRTVALRLNATMINEETGLVDQERLRAFNTLIKERINWQTHLKRSKRMKK